MRITPLEIRQHTFDKSFRGYDTESVDAFLLSLSQEWERVAEEVRVTKQLLDRAEQEVTRVKEIESSLFKTIKVAEEAQKEINEKMKEDAPKTPEAKMEVAKKEADMANTTKDILKTTEPAIQSAKPDLAKAEAALEEAAKTLASAEDKKAEVAQDKALKALEAAKENFGSKSNKIKKVGDNPPKYINSNLSMFEEGDVITIDNIYYDYGRYNIRPDAARELEKLVSLMKRYPKMRIDLRSHTDSRSSTEFNQKLSENRSKSVVSYLRKRGIGSTRLESSGFGETQLLNECADGVECTEEQHQTNRRTEFKVIQMQ